MRNNTKQSPKSKKDKEALAEKLRLNLLRRKEQQRSKQKKGDKNAQ